MMFPGTLDAFSDFSAIIGCSMSQPAARVVYRPFQGLLAGCMQVYQRHSLPACDMTVEASLLNGDIFVNTGCLLSAPFHVQTNLWSMLFL